MTGSAGQSGGCRGCRVGTRQTPLSSTVFLVRQILWECHRRNNATKRIDLFKYVSNLELPYINKDFATYE